MHYQKSQLLLNIKFDRTVVAHWSGHVEKPHYQHGICLPFFPAKSQDGGIAHDYPKSNQIEKTAIGRSACA